MYTKFLKHIDSVKSVMHTCLEPKKSLHNHFIGQYETKDFENNLNKKRWPHKVYHTKHVKRKPVKSLVYVLIHYTRHVSWNIYKRNSTSDKKRLWVLSVDIVFEFTMNVYANICFREPSRFVNFIVLAKILKQ